jgi:hypothetical protein
MRLKLDMAYSQVTELIALLHNARSRDARTS